MKANITDLHDRRSPAGLLELSQGSLVVAAQPLVAGHLLVHLLLQVLLLLPLHYRGRPDGRKVFRVNCRFIRVKIWTHGKFSWIDLKRKMIIRT